MHQIGTDNYCEVYPRGILALFGRAQIYHHFVKDLWSTVNKRISYSFPLNLIFLIFVTYSQFSSPTSHSAGIRSSHIFLASYNISPEEKKINWIFPPSTTLVHFQKFYQFRNQCVLHLTKRNSPVKSKWADATPCRVKNFSTILAQFFSFWSPFSPTNSLDFKIFENSLLRM